MTGGGRSPRLKGYELDGDDGLRPEALCTLDGVVLHLRALSKGLEALAGDRRVVDENVLATLFRGDEAVPLRVVEPLNGSSCHKKTPPLAMKERAREAHCAQPVLAQLHK